MNDFYTAKWALVRHIEGASQRIQEDTMRFASIMKTLGVSIVDAVMTLIAFLPVLPVIRNRQRVANRWFYCISFSLCCAICPYLGQF